VNPIARAVADIAYQIIEGKFEEVRTPLPKWARDLIEQQDGGNWKKVRHELLA
jgi:hypothetical protein